MNRLKYILLLLIMALSTPLFAENYIGIRAGVGGGSIRLLPAEETASNWATPMVGLSYKYYGGDKFFGAVEVDLSFMERGYKILPRVDSDSAYVRTMNTVQLAFLWQPHFFMFQEKAQMFLNLGPYFCYDLSSKEEFRSKQQGVLWKKDYLYDPIVDNRLGYGLSFGAGLSFAITKRIRLQGEFRYDFGMSDIFKNTNQNAKNPLESPTDFLYGAAGVFYKF